MRLPTHAPHAFGPSTLDPFRVDLGRYVSYGRVEDGRGSLGPTANAPCRFPASGFPTGFTARHSTGPHGAGVGGTERRVLGAGLRTVQRGMKKRQRLDAIEVKCDACDGNGYPPVRQPAPRRKTYPAPCKKCGGKGRVITQDS
jgi:hypothetical protein